MRGESRSEFARSGQSTLNCCKKYVAKLTVQSVGSGGIAEPAAGTFPYFEETFRTTKGWFA